VHSGAYGRMDPNEPAYTITTRLNTPSVGRITHPIDNRTITPREAARIQSFPDHYRFLGDITTIGMQIGNSVPPLLAKKIGENIVSSLNDATQI
ncbi:MAG: DNA cytosine methyltransferase, partial [Lactobacillus sp.]|nr:DNA cytosine methyltransferase [Lactobacillus sp.]